MLGYILLVIGLVGFGYAGYSDLKTTEFPDWLPYSIIILALVFRLIFAFLQSDIWIFLNALIVGVIFLGFGFLLYLSRQWGDGDAWLLGAMGFLFPTPTGFAYAAIIPFPLTIIFNFFLLSFVYLIFYSIALGIKNRNMSNKFLGELKGDFKNIVIATIVFGIACFLFFNQLSGLHQISLPLNYLLLFPVILFTLLVFVHYARFIESNLFKKRIHVRKLKVGDVPVNQKWKVMSKKDLRKLKERGGFIWIKEGVRFAPVFILTLIFTILFGNLIFLFI